MNKDESKYYLKCDFCKKYKEGRTQITQTKVACDDCTFALQEKWDNERKDKK